MRPLAIRIENLGKAYHIARAAEGRRYKTLREDLMAVPGRLRSWLHGRDQTEERIWALRDVSFDVREGEVVGVIGRNGAGKTTLLKILSRITDPTQGRAEVYGRVGALLEVGTGFHPELTGRENIYLNGAVLGLRRAEIERNFDEIVAFSEVEQFLETPVKRYSSGMYMRLAFAVAAHLDPEIMVVDEVLAVGDAGFQKKCLGKMEEVGRSGRTVLFVSHNMNAVNQLCSRAVLLRRGRVQLDSTDVGRVIREHLFGNDSATGLAEWVNDGDAPATPWFAPRRFFLADAEGGPRPIPVSNQGDIWLQIEGDIERIDPAFNVGYALYSEGGSLLYWSFCTDQTQERWPRIEPGRRVFRTRIPPRFLNEGDYRIELLASLHFRKWLLEPGVSAPSIVLAIRGGLSDSPLYLGKRPGLLAPIMDWVTGDS